MSTITKGWLQQAINDYESVRDELPFGLDDYQGNILAALRIALASLEAKSRKLFICSGCGAEGLDEPLESKCHCNEDGAHWVEGVVYTAPPAPVVPPEQNWEELCQHNPEMPISDAIIRAASWNACRAAMLQGSDCNSPVIADGWVASSERMPNIGVPVITCCGDVVQYAAYAWDGKEWQDWYEEYDKLPANTFTHWHPRPAAPQQEAE